MNVIENGKYRHYKGGLYEVIGMATNSETLEEMVIYRALYDDSRVWVRPASMWNDIITKNGNTQHRFEPADLRQ